MHLERARLIALAPLACLLGCGSAVPPPSGQGGGAPVGSGGSKSGGTGGTSAPTGAGGVAGTAGVNGAAGMAAAPDAGPSAPTRPPLEVKPIPARPPRRAGNTVFHSTNVSMWEIQDPAHYQRFKASYDEIISILERGYPAIEARLGTGHELPIRVIIETGGCCGGFAGGGDVGYMSGNFEDAGGLGWTRGVVLGEVVNGVTGAVSSGWPRDWWADTAWYFPGFIAVEVMKEVVPAHAGKWERDEKYPTYPVYKLYQELLAEQGWAVYQRLFASVKKDEISWEALAANPSPLRTNYVIAYLSLAAGQNLGARFMAARVNGVDTAMVQAVMDAHARLTGAGAAATAQRWMRFRRGDHAGAVSGL